jgi:hypothetical protein|tara:strand:- start:369 stop:551 length:183 start_codon:yes stop_codon:yes gene_type:complete
MTQPVEYEQTTYNDSEGAQMGKSATEKIGFYGATPIVQQAAPADAAAIVVVLQNLGLVAS